MRPLLLALALCLPVSALAQSGPPAQVAQSGPPAQVAQSGPPAAMASVRRMMAEMDTDKDGFVGREEFLAAHTRTDHGFERLDTNRNDVLSRDEFMAGSIGQGRAERFRGLDSNNDGRVTREELDARRNARFDALDDDRDGKLSPQEMRSAQTAMRRDALDPRTR